MKKLLIQSKGVARWVELGHLTVVGGKNATGIKIPDLKHADDYVVVAPSHDRIIIHPLKGKKRTSWDLEDLKPMEIEDLTLLLSSFEAESQSLDEGPEDVLTLLKTLGDQENLEISLTRLLKTVLATAQMEKGLIITRDLENAYHISAQENVSGNEPWMSESLVQDVIQSKRPKILQNIYGSGFETRKSLVASGFVSVFAWPLVVRGECLGVILIGSRRPHSGLDEKHRQKLEGLVQLAGLILNFHLRDLKTQEEVAALRKQLSSSDSPLLTQDSKLSETCQVAAQVAATDLSVLIQGETGVGKEVLATWIHRSSERSNRPFVTLNCGAIPGELLESLLFGHKKGSFTGAHADQVGKFQVADRGTLFLDEIGDLPEGLQVKLLRVLQEKIVEPIGSHKAVKVNVRVIAATHKDIAKLIEQKRFREDLYYRIAEITLRIPPLAERPEDVPLLAMQFLKQFGPNKRFSDEAWSWLKSQKWKGNVRELQSHVKRAALLSAGQEIRKSDFLKGMVTQAEENWLGGKDLEEAKANFVSQKVQTALRMVNGHRLKAAELLGVTPRTLYRYLEEEPQSMTDLSV